MSTLNDVQNAMVDVITLTVYPNTTSSPSIAGSLVTSVTVDDGGIDYTIATITFTGGGGTGATATATIVLGVITAITIVEKGFGYTSAPTVVITGDGSGAMATSVLSPINIYVAAGDFLKQNLDPGLLARQIFVSVFAVQGMTRNTTRLRRDWVVDDLETPTITLTVEDDTVTVGGTVTVDQASMIVVQGTGYSYIAQTGDTLDDIADELADLIPTATATGAVITVPGVFHMIARVSVPGTARRILNSQESIVRARIIAPDYQSRELVGAAIQIAFGSLGDLDGYIDYYLPMPDLISASIKANKIIEVNMYEMDNAFCRDYMYLVEYHTVQVSTFQTIADINLDVEIEPLS